MKGSVLMPRTPASHIYYKDRPLPATLSEMEDWLSQDHAIATIPYQLNTLEWTGNAQEPIWNGFDANVMTLSGVTRGTNAGRYQAVFTPKKGFYWAADGSTDGRVVEWEIKPKPITNNVTVTSTHTYTGNEQTATLAGIDNNLMTVSGQTAGRNTGTYTINIALAANRCWPDGKTGTKQVTWTIAKAAGSISLSGAPTTLNTGSPVQVTAHVHAGATVSARSSNAGVATVTVSGTTVTVTGGSMMGESTITVTASESANYLEASTTFTVTTYLAALAVPSTIDRTYTGSSQGPNWSGLDTAKMTTGGTLTATNAGTYEATVTPKAGYRWTDGTAGSKTVRWTIAKAAGSVTLNYTSGSTDKNGTEQVTATAHSGATLSASSGNTNIATVAISGNKITMTGGGMAGTTTITITASAGPNHLAASATYTVTNYLASLTVPTTTNRTYTGSSQEPNWNGFDAAKMSKGGTLYGTDAGSYDATVTPKAGYRWGDGSSGAKTVRWTIDKAAGSLALSTSAVTVGLSGTSKTVTVTRAGTGKVSAASNNPDVASVSVSGTTVTINAGIRGSATVTVSVASDKNYVAPPNKTVTITNDAPPADPKERGPEEIKAIVDADKADEYINPGDLTPLIPLNGAMGGVTFTNYKVRFKVMDVYDGHPIFMLWENEAGRPVCLVTTKSVSYVDANASGICMNRRGQYGNTIDNNLSDEAKKWGPNMFGWLGTYCRCTLMAQFKALLPDEWQDVIIPTGIWTDNNGNHSNVPSNVSATTDDCFLPDEYELYGKNTFGNGYCDRKQRQWAYPKAGNSLVANRHDNPTEAWVWFARGPGRDTEFTFCAVDHNGCAGNQFAARTIGVRPCFRV